MVATVARSVLLRAGRVLIHRDQCGQPREHRTQQNSEFHQRTKHIDIQWHWIRERVEEGSITFNYVPTTEMVADVLTKALSKEQRKHQ